MTNKISFCIRKKAPRKKKRKKKLLAFDIFFTENMRGIVSGFRLFFVIVAGCQYPDWISVSGLDISIRAGYQYPGWISVSGLDISIRSIL
jgi:hypothetical protein